MKLTDSTETTDLTLPVHSQTEPAPAPTPVPRTPPAVDRLARFRPYFGVPVSVQLPLSVPYFTISPAVTENGPVMQALTGPDGVKRTYGHPALNTKDPVVVLVGVLRPSECETFMVLRMGISAPPAQEEIPLLPEQVAYLTCVTHVEPPRRILGA